VSFRDLKPEFDALDINILGISRDLLVSHQKFIDNHSLDLVLLSDPDATVMKLYQAFGEKTMYGKTVSGVIRSSVLISPEGVIKKHWTKVARAEQHPAQVLEYIRQVKG